VIALDHIASGKVRDIYEIDPDHLLLVASDRISAYDVVLGEPIPDKGRVLTSLSEFWFDRLDTPHHFITSSIADIDGIDGDDRDYLAGRSMIVRRADVIPVECVVRGYLYGSSWSEYRDGGGPTTEHLPDGLELASLLSEPIFTPATKAEVGDHDENLTEQGARNILGDDLYEQLKATSIEIYATARQHAAYRGVLLADTKFEFGYIGGQVSLIDEVLTPDSSRYWPADEYEPGSTVPSFDKQFVRDWLMTTDWDRTPPAPTLPDEVVAGTRSRYLEAYELITGHPLVLPDEETR
jgi:phosphoribosylaminoimidazole-succinocarboxamide synthase